LHQAISTQSTEPTRLMAFGMCSSLLWLAAVLRSKAASSAEDSCSARSCVVEADFSTDLETNFVQQQLTVQRQQKQWEKDRVKERESERGREREREKASERESVQETLPSSIHWVHTARTGSSFMTTLLQLRDPICMPGSGHLIDNTTYPTVKDVRTWCPGIALYGGCSDDTYFHACSEVPIGGLDSKGKLVGFFRQPEVRLMSDWHACKPPLFPCNTNESELERFAQLRQGCMVKMLTEPPAVDDSSDGAYHCISEIEPTWAQVDRALERVQNEYAFIGMTDDWDLSICLFNAMFGNACHSNQFQETNYTSSSSSSSDVSPLKGFVDPYDGVLWDAAQRIFQENLRRFNVSRENCQPCYGID